MQDLNEFAGNVPVEDRDLEKLKSEDFDKYVIDLRNGPFVTYSEDVFENVNFFDDVNFALLDLAWKVRLEDASGGENLRKKMETMIDEKGKRFGFIFAYTLLTSCHAVEDDPRTPAEKKFRISEGLQKMMVENIDDYLNSIEMIDDENEEQIENDVRAVANILTGSFLNVAHWKDNELKQNIVKELREESTPVGEGYLTIDNSVALFRHLIMFGKKEIVSDRIKISAIIALSLEHDSRLRAVGVEV